MPNENTPIKEVDIKMLDVHAAIKTDILESDLFIKKKVSVSVLRIDQIHPVVSGNKLFKLHYFLQEALTRGCRTIISFGGPYSNHLLATAFACRSAGLCTIGIVRGEEPALLSPILQQCLGYGMVLQFISRENYALKDDPLFISDLLAAHDNYLVIPEGGFHPNGAKGAALIMDTINNDNYSHICTATGTATTLAGLLMGARNNQLVIGIPVLKGLADLPERIVYLTGKKMEHKRPWILDNCHFGGYAKRTPGLIQFMNDCWKQFQLPLDFVYTAKMFYAIMEAVRSGQFETGSKILCLHTGGLQGNDSLPPGTLLFQ